MSRRKVPELDTPFSSVEWPVISQENQDTILELLCTLLAPIGQHRRDHVELSRGKRSRRKSRQKFKDIAGEASKEADGVVSLTSNAADGKGKAVEEAKRPSDNIPPPPDLLQFIDVGLVTITRELAKSAAPGSVIPAQGAPKDTSHPSPTTPSSSPSSSISPYAAVFVVRSGHSSAFYSHFPQMVAVASQQVSAAPDSPSSPIRLVGFSRACEDRLGTSLEIPRVSAVAIRAGAPQSQGLLKFLEETVSAVDVRWLGEAQTGKFRNTHIHMAEVTVGPKRKKKA
ncbi:RNase P and RNase MRP subunit [Sporothrix eucalyptigena]|uniref:RNase P and RNase MRP subunit n=1 Tax=Sporothrix eucalyptigena TaxID=1812306 RepID=A0ABP0BNW3_9PEZI